MASSSEFIALCRSQVSLLASTWGADASAIYLTTVDGESKLVPIVIYPEDQTLWTHGNSLPPAIDDLTREGNDSNDLGSTLVYSSPELQSGSKGHSNLLNDPRQIWLPLIYQEQMLGLLVVTRYLVPWSDRERKQIEQIGETITLACALERRYLWMERELNHQLELKEQQRDLLHDLLHQIRNPLTAIRTFGKLLVRRLLPEDPNREVSNHIIRESDRVEDLLRYLSRVIDQENEVLIENNSPNSPKLLPDSQIKEKSSLPLSLPMGNLVIEHIPLDGLLLPLIASATAIASDRQIKLVNKLPLNLPMVKGNRDGLREVFSNLLDNAIKYTPNQGKVTVQSIKKTGFQGIRITDNGLGIPAEDLDKLFTRGYRGKQALGDIPGTGLGLAIVKDLLTVMGGEIEIKSIVRSGTTIIVWLEIVP